MDKRYKDCLLSVDWCFEPVATFTDVNAYKKDSIPFSYLDGEFQVSVARVQFVEENVSFVEVRHDGQGIVHVALIERGELVFLFQFFLYRAHERVGQ